MNNINKLINWNESIGLVISKKFSAEAIAELLKGLEQLVGASSGLVTIFPLSQPPKSTHHRFLAHENPQNQIEAYDAGAYLLDPFYRIALDEKAQGPFTIKDVTPEGFEHSEYYNLFYKQLGLLDEICILFQLEDRSIVSISLVRHAEEKHFTKADISQIEIVYPLIRSILISWQEGIKEKVLPNLERQLDNALTNFGDSVLTPRESKVIHFILHGYAIKTIAKKLENSVETIKYHRKNIYLKLDVSSQSELFYLFISSLKSMPEGSLVDPLTFLK